MSQNNRKKCWYHFAVWRIKLRISGLLDQELGRKALHNRENGVNKKGKNEGLERHDALPAPNFPCF